MWLWKKHEPIDFANPPCSWSSTVILDASNTLKGCRHVSLTRIDPNVWLDVPELLRIIRHHPEPKTYSSAFAGGLLPFHVQQQIERGGHTIIAPASAATREGFVDDALQRQLLNVVLALTGIAARTRLVLVTGDGNDNGGRGGFPHCVRHALRHGWFVEVWSWRFCMSAAYFALLREPGLSNGALTIHFLDDYRTTLVKTRGANV